MDEATFADMLNPATEVAQAIANGTLQNIIMSLGNTQKNVKTITCLFLFFVCFRIVQLLCYFSKRMDLFARTIILSLQSVTFYLCILAVVLMAFACCCVLYYGDRFEPFSNVAKASLTVFLIILRDSSLTEDMYRRNPNVMLNIHFLMLITIKFVMFYIFFSIVYTAYIQVETRKNKTVKNLDQILDEKHWTNRIRDFFSDLQQRCQRQSKESLQREIEAEKQRVKESREVKATTSMLKRQQAKGQQEQILKEGPIEQSHMTISSSESSQDSQSSDSQDEGNFGRNDLLNKGDVRKYTE